MAKSYTENSSVNNLDFKQSCRAATNGSLTLSGIRTVDGVVLSVGDRVLVKNQTNSTQNGIYSVSNGSWSRALDCNENSEITGNFIVFIEEGNLNADTGWVLTSNDPVIIGTSDLVFSCFIGRFLTMDSSGDVLISPPNNGSTTITARTNMGISNTLDSTATYGSIIGGYQSKASMYGEIAHSAGGFANVPGTAQHRIFVARGLTLSGQFTVTIASPAVFTRNGHSLSVGDTVRLSTTGSLPIGLNTTTNYYVISNGLSGNNFQLSTTRNGTPINTSGTQSGTHTLLPTTSLTLNGAVGTATPALMVIPERSTWSYNIKISAYSSQNNQGAAWHAFGGLRRNLSTTIELETTQGYTYLENSFAAGLISIEADSLTNSLDIRTTGVINQSVRWAAVIDLVQVSFGTP